MTETKVEAPAKKRQGKPGLKRVTVSIAEDDYKALATFAENEMREPNNLLSYLLKGRIKGMLDEEKGE